MARVNFGLVITEARGKAGEVVYSRDRGGALIKRIPTYHQPLTNDVIAVRALMATIGAEWYNTLTEQQRQAWRTFGQGIKWRNSLAGTNVPAGSDLYTQCNFNSRNLGGSQILDPPPRLSAPDPGPLTCTANGDTGQLTVNATVPLPPNHAPLLMATAPVTAGWYNVNKSLRQLGRGVTPPLITTLPDASLAYQAKFGPPQPGMKIGISLAYINLLTGARSPASTQLIIVSQGVAMLKATLTLSSAQILALGITPVQLIPAPGPGRVLLLSALLIKYNFNTTPYTIPASPEYRVGFNSTPIYWDAGFTGLIDQTHNLTMWASFTAGAWPVLATDSDCINLPLSIYAGPGATFTLGDGTLDVIIYYSVETP